MIHYILEPLLSCGTGFSKICGMRQVFSFTCETFTATLPSSVITKPLVLFNTVKIVQYQQPHVVLNRLFILFAESVVVEQLHTQTFEKYIFASIARTSDEFHGKLSTESLWWKVVSFSNPMEYILSAKRMYALKKLYSFFVMVSFQKHFHLP